MRIQLSETGKFSTFFERGLKRPALLCSLLLGFCTLASYPFVEMAQCDDFSYIRSAKTLAETGHIIYYGWASAMLGWQLALGALFIKIFGFSFSATYASVLLVALATAFLLQRTFVLLGLRETNAAFATLTLVLSPLFLPLSSASCRIFLVCSRSLSACIFAFAPSGLHFHRRPKPGS
jgi:hypothetical protein